MNSCFFLLASLFVILTSNLNVDTKKNIFFLLTQKGCQFVRKISTGSETQLKNYRKMKKKTDMVSVFGVKTYIST